MTPTDTSSSHGADGKPKRVRTGCRTCRDRHLKCDEGLPKCRNCAKSSRTCVYGIKLNFIDTKCRAPPVLTHPGQGHRFTFQDDSREIASEYKDGLARYGPRDTQSPAPSPVPDVHYPLKNTFVPAAGNLSLTTTLESPTSDPQQHDPPHVPNTTHDRQDIYHPDEGYSSSLPQASISPFNADLADTASQNSFVGWLTDPNELLYMKAFIDEVGLWMDSLNEQKHFSRILPFRSMQIPMLKDAFLACGARHLSLVNPKHSEESALHYYDTATRYLLHALEDPRRDTVVCATTAVVLNVYEIMCERALQRMNHIAGARALIKECGWNAKSKGVGAACFWLNVGMELLSCLHFNWQVAWDPDGWGLDTDMHPETEDHREELWTYRIMHITAKIGNFRASATMLNDSHGQGSPRAEHARQQQRYNDWCSLLKIAQRWHDCIPSTMHPLGMLQPHTTQSDSAFPEVYLGGKRTSTVARLFYHTAMVLLAQTNPYPASDLGDMQAMQMLHSTLICGIVAHTEDRGVASVAIRSLAIAAECLTKRNEQEEVLHIFENIRRQTGWRVGFVHTELPTKWGWPDVAVHASDLKASNPQRNASVSSLTSQSGPQIVSPVGNVDLGTPMHAAVQHAHHYAQLHNNTPMPTPPSKQPFKGLDGVNFFQPNSTQAHNTAHGAPFNQTQPVRPSQHLFPVTPTYQQGSANHNPSTNSTITPSQQSQTARQPNRPRVPAGIPNPLLSGADFSLSTHPYQNHYVAPMF